MVDQQLRRLPLYDVSHMINKPGVKVGILGDHTRLYEYVVTWTEADLPVERATTVIATDSIHVQRICLFRLNRWLPEPRNIRALKITRSHLMHSENEADYGD